MKDAFTGILEEVANFFSISLRKEIRLTRINNDTLRIWSETWRDYNKRIPPNGGWDWIDKTKLHKKKFDKKLLDFAILSENKELCGLVLCTRSNSHEIMYIRYMEGSIYDNHSLKGLIFNIVDTVCMSYAEIYNTKKIRIVDPVNTLIPYYDLKGYVLKKGLFNRNKYCEKGVKNGDSMS